jgi:exosome complex component CSL4
VQAVLNIIAVDGKQCQQDWQGIIRIADIRQTDKDKIKIWDCFRPGDVVRASVVCDFRCAPSLVSYLTDPLISQISLGDVRSYYLSTAQNNLGVVFAKHSESGNRLQPINWQEMQDPITGLSESRKVAGPSV